MAEKLEDLNLPNAVVGRLIKEALSDNVFVGKEARTALGRAASVFVLYITSQASNVAKKSNRKTITGQDILDALSDLEFDEFIEPLKQYQETFKELQKKKKEGLPKTKQKKTEEALNTDPEIEHVDAEEEVMETEEMEEVEEEDEDES